MMPITVSAPRSPRLVTVMVGSVSSELPKPPVRARWTRSRSADSSSASDFWSASWMAGAISPRPRSEMVLNPGCVLAKNEDLVRQRSEQKADRPSFANGICC